MPPETVTVDKAAIRTRLRRLHRAHVRAEDNARAAREALYDLAVEASAAGVTLEEIGADLGGLSKQRVSDVVRARRAG